jgi:4-hydroxy-tetrahydrodipicolinate reductase
MRVALIGYGKMGKMIEKHLILKGHSISKIIDVDNYSEIQEIHKNNTDVIIEFTTPVEVKKNLSNIIPLEIPVVIGTTGWYSHLKEIEQWVSIHNGTVIYGTNFSIGVNILFIINELLAKLMNKFPDYDVFIEERHHNQKKDAPSGTALTLANQIIQHFEKKNEIASSLSERNPQPNELTIGSIRGGEIIGKHLVGYSSKMDLIEISHDAYNREAFALGAIISAEWALELKGIHEFKDLFKKKMLEGLV